MTAPEYETEVHRRIYRNRDGSYLSVCPDRDGMNLVEIRAVVDGGEVSRFVVTPEEARLLAPALAACADEVDAR